MSVAVRAFPAPEASRGRRPRAIAVVTAMGIVLLAAGTAFSLLPMRVRAVSIVGSRYLTSAEIGRLAGLVPGTLVGWREARKLERKFALHPAFVSARVSRRFDGTLAIRVVEREPTAWLPAFGCAVSADGRLLTHLTSREPSWMSISGIEARDGRVGDSSALAEVAFVGVRTREISPNGGTWRRIPGNPGAWEWSVDGKKVVFSSPVSEDEIKILQRFQREFPREWGRSRVLDLRFADRVVIKR